MALRFQDVSDDVDRAAKPARRGMILSFLFIAAFVGVFAWVSGKSLHSYEQDIAVGAACFWAVWIIVPIYEWFRIRTKEIYGTVTEIEKAVSAVKEDQKKLLERLSAIDERLGELSEKVESMNPGEVVAYSTGGIREGLRTIEEKLGCSEPQK